MSKVLTSLPVGERVGIAFSGGLDTSVAVAWMREKGAVPCTYTADLGQYDEPDIDSVPGRAVQYGAELSRLVDCTEALVEEGLSAIACGAFHVRSGGKTYFNTTPLGRAVTGTLLVRAMHADERLDLGRRLDLQGQRHRAVLPLRPARQPEPADLQAVAGRRLRRRARRPPRDVGVAHRARPALPRSTEKAYSTDANIWGATHEAKTLEHLDVDGGRRADHGREALGPSVAIVPEDVTVEFRQGRPVAINGRRSTSAADVIREANTIGGRHGLGMSDQIENRIIEAKSRGIYEAPGMALLHIAYERLLNAIHNEDTIANYHPEGRRLGRLLYEGRWLDPQTLMMRESLQRWIASAVTGEVTLRLRRGDDYSIVDTRGPEPSLPPGQAVDGAHRGRRVRPGRPDRPADHAQPRHRRHPRQARAVRGPGPARRRPHGALFGELEAGGASAIAADPTRTTPTWSGSTRPRSARCSTPAPTDAIRIRDRWLHRAAAAP